MDIFETLLAITERILKREYTLFLFNLSLCNHLVTTYFGFRSSSTFLNSDKVSLA